MNFRRLSLLLALAVAAFTVSARAQLGVYGTVNVQQIGINGKNIAPVGGGGGVYYDFKQFGRVKLGADLRGNVASSKQGNDNGFNGVGTRVHTVLGGVRASTTLPVTWIKPYVQGSVGWGGSNFGISREIKGGLAYEGFAGVDLRLASIMDVRLVEFGVGSIHANNTSNTLKSISMGVVFHLP
ncbi:outer membrane beta-barrel protein [Terriglobus tenax]|uniref:outer membrane beta-barrel protein n=1 Tax=Terriglobus tenax TaxID=1111115 RepID=UPI0021E037DF|nr:outer membrane beta-barrel protein [Terriglobus tenax]